MAFSSVVPVDKEGKDPVLVRSLSARGSAGQEIKAVGQFGTKKDPESSHEPTLKLRIKQPDDIIPLVHWGVSE